MGDADELPRLYTLKEVSDHTGFALRTLERDCRAGRVVHVHRGRDRLMTVEQVAALIQQHTTQPSPVPSEIDEYRARLWEREARKLARRVKS